MTALAHWCVRRRNFILVGWVALLIGLAAAIGAVGSNFSDANRLPASDSSTAYELLGKAGRTIIAHENTRLWLTTDVTWSWNGQRFKRLPKIAQRGTVRDLRSCPGFADENGVDSRAAKNLRQARRDAE